jgi:hypothetical protein
MSTRSLIIAAVLAACAAPRDPDTLGEAVRSYNDGVRWGRYGIAAAKVPAAERHQFIDDMDERANDVKITDYEVLDIAARGKEARVRIKMEWYLASAGTVHETHAVQRWERTGKVWMMVGEQRVRGEAMPGLAEPTTGDARTPPR